MDGCFAGRLRESRRALGMSQNGLARRMEISVNTIQEWESGRGRPNVDHFLTLCDVFSWEPFEFFAGRGEPARRTA